MYLMDLSAIDKLIDWYNENCIVTYNESKYTLYDLKENFIDQNLSCSTDQYSVKKDGIYFDNRRIILVNDLRSNAKDDLISL